MNKTDLVEKSISSYLANNRTNIDESLVSLRFMKEIDDFLHYNNLNQKDLAKELDVSQAFISQLLSGTKKINVGFINKFEKRFDIEFKLNLKNNNSKYTVVEIVDSSIQIKSSQSNFISVIGFSSNNSNNPNAFYKIENESKMISIK